MTSKLSNIAQVALFIPQAEPGPDQSPPNPSPDENQSNPRVNIVILVLLVVGSVAIVSTIIGATIYILKKKKISRRPRIGF